MLGHVRSSIPLVCIERRRAIIWKSEPLNSPHDDGEFMVLGATLWRCNVSGRQAPTRSAGEGWKMSDELQFLTKLLEVC
jgi:hypothetical protein